MSVHEFRGVRYVVPDPPKNHWWKHNCFIFFHHWTEWVEKLDHNAAGRATRWIQFRECIRCGKTQRREPKPKE